MAYDIHKYFIKRERKEGETMIITTPMSALSFLFVFISLSIVIAAVKVMHASTKIPTSPPQDKVGARRG